MKELKILLVCVSVIFCSAATAKPQGWREIRPLHATREDVERLIGPPMQPNGATYDLKGERVNIGYSEVRCAKGWPYGWNVPARTVTSVTIYPQPRPKLSDLPIDISKSTKYVDPTGVIHYNNDEEGLSVAVDPSEYEVMVLEYYPAASDAHLRCPEAAERERQIANGESEVRPPDVNYSDASLEKKQVYLDYFADRLHKSSPDSTVYIIAYAGQRARVGETQTRANQAKDYLTSKRGIEPGRIVTIDGGHRDPAGVDLYIIPRGQPKPLASPNVYPGNVQIIKDSNASNNRPRPLRQQAEVRKFVWEHWRERRLGYVTFTMFSKEGEPSTSHVFVEPDEEGIWRVAVKIDRMVVERHGSKRRHRSSNEYIAYALERIEVPTSGLDEAILIPDTDLKKPDLYRLILKDRAGKVLSSL